MIKPQFNQYVCQKCRKTYSSEELSRQLIQMFNCPEQCRQFAYK
ncbi:hypothetical protein KKC1_10940 [Calderihabitans maritimus]|uniref:Uncharacterized protein n=2 Tax=Calderihabitans maritimus TaxID=1246530 RepID=A0A1Z5HQZ7_9FIRM|nr:hypothetical protein KKC1_10940 [Calderihabitans maritimus]